jgi:hypothetical protein
MTDNKQVEQWKYDDFKKAVQIVPDFDHINSGAAINRIKAWFIDELSVRMTYSQFINLQSLLNSGTAVQERDATVSEQSGEAGSQKDWKLKIHQAGRDYMDKDRCRRNSWDFQAGGEWTLENVVSPLQAELREARKEIEGWKAMWKTATEKNASYKKLYDSEHAQRIAWYYEAAASKAALNKLEEQLKNLSQQPQWVKVDDMFTQLPETLSDQFDVDFYGNYLMQISKVDGVWKVTNAINGWGSNVAKDFKNSKVTFLAASTPQQNLSQQPQEIDGVNGLWSERVYELLSALCSMWNQYCPEPVGHMCMSAGEEAADALDRYKLLKKDSGYGGSIDWERLAFLKSLLDESTPQPSEDKEL